MKIRSDDFYISKIRLWRTRVFGFFGLPVIVIPIVHRLILSAMNGGRDVTVVPGNMFVTVLKVICLIMGLYSLYKLLTYNKLRKENLAQTEQIKNEGMRLVCTIEKIERVSNLAKVHKITLTNTDRFGITRTFLSDELYFDPTQFLRGKTELEVIVDRGDDERYVILYPSDFPKNGAFHYF